MIPRNAFYFKNGDLERVKKNIIIAINFVFILGFPIMFGLMATASNFSPWFFGPGYDDVPQLIMIFSTVIYANITVTNALNMYFKMCFSGLILPKEKKTEMASYRTAYTKKV